MGLVQEEPTIFDVGRPGLTGVDLGPCDVPGVEPTEVIPEDWLRREPAELPEVSEPDVVRHYTRLSQWNYSIDTGLYPLGSCTMKYNPRMNEAFARLEGFARLHPYLPAERVQGAYRLMVELQEMLCEISGLDACSLQPAAGAQGELTGLLCIRAYHRQRGQGDRRTILVPDSAHGTNPASAALCGMKAVQIQSGQDGIVHPDAVRARIDEKLAGIMITNPNTLGLFESHIEEICRLVHESGGLVYCDGANMNGVMGRSRPGDWGVDVMHLNLHKTFSTPHGGGGPGAGPICVRRILEPFLPVPRIERDEEGHYLATTDRPLSIGRVRSFYGQFLVLVRAYAYIKTCGYAGLRAAAESAVLNANYLRVRLQEHFPIAHDRSCMHECIFSDQQLQAYGVKTLDVAKRLIDYGFHPPTVYFPLIVKGALMIEPTESENRQTLDRFVSAMAAIAREARENPELLHQAPSRAFRRRLDETQANRRPILTYRMGAGQNRKGQGSKNQSV
ncbi:MAG: aminomethyl-transferring glycine dehydrogenase subunit GcvPB [Bradymonadales bacterium]|nr:aminomethyl-transferring glycine dehydrogenase subunit GcvPB [Bradymonadales bacterium]